MPMSYENPVVQNYVVTVRFNGYRILKCWTKGFS